MEPEPFGAPLEPAAEPFCVEPEVPVEEAEPPPVVVTVVPSADVTVVLVVPLE